jgi:hypothetical protein
MTISPSKTSAALDAWRRADADAREVELRLAAAWKAFDEKSGPAPDEQLFARVALFRAIAHDKLTAVLEAMKAVTGHEPNEVKGGWREQHGT